MDLGRFLQVAWRFRTLLAAGFVLATLLAAMSLFRISFDGAIPSPEYKEDNTWLTASTLLVTQDGFPWGRAILDDMIPTADGEVGDDGKPQLMPRFGDPGRYSGLAALYSELAKGDAVRREAMQGANPGQYYEPMVVQQPGASSSLPMIYIKGYGRSPQDAITVAERASQSFIAYLNEQQSASGIPEEKRVQVIVTQRFTPPEVFASRSFIRPVMLFILIMTASVALAFGLENLRPRHRSHRGRHDGEVVEGLPVNGRIPA